MARVSYTPNQDQRRAITSTSKGIRIVAPAGSGKTDTLVLRAINLIESKRILPQRILILSFDNSAKKSFEQKYRRLAPSLPMPLVRTINKFSKDQLRGRFRQELGETGQDGQLLKDYNREWGQLDVLSWDGRSRKVHDVFRALKNQGLLPDACDSTKAHEWLRQYYFKLPDHGEILTMENLHTESDDLTPRDLYSADIRQLFDAYERYDREMRERGWMDLDDQKLRLLSQLRRHRADREAIQGLYDEIVVDECQDISRLDASLLYFVAGPATTLVLAGDDDQSLYEFREANSLYLREPGRHFDRVFETIHLNINYRTPAEILNPAVRLIQHNRERIDKSTHSGVVHPGEVEIIATASPTDTLTILTERVNSLIGSTSVEGRVITPADIAILCSDSIRTRIRNTFSRAGIAWAGVPTKPTDEPTPRSVVIDTFRMAKGRQWPVVVLPESNDGIIPGPDMLRVGDMESARRLYYVAMTRASERLIVTYSRIGDFDFAQRTSNGETLGTNGASRFLFEAGLIVEPPLSTTLTQVHLVNDPRKRKDIHLSARSGQPKSNSNPTTHAREPSSKKVSEAKVPEVTAPAPSSAMTAPWSIDRVGKGITSTPEKKRAIHPWDLREAERKSLAKSADRLKAKDYTYALQDSWKVIEQFLRRVTNDKSKSRAVDLIDFALKLRLINPYWFGRIGNWRRLRNKYEHDEIEFQACDLPALEELVQRTPELLDHIRRAMRPTQTNLFSDEPKLIGLFGLADAIQNGVPSPLTGKPIRALRFDPTVDGKDILALQLLFIVRDIRFFTPPDCRWNTAPVFHTLSSEFLGFRHRALRSVGNHAIPVTSQAAHGEAMVMLRRIVEIELGADTPALSLQSVLDDAHLTSNGNFPSGLQLNPKR